MELNTKILYKIYSYKTADHSKQMQYSFTKYIDT